MAVWCDANKALDGIMAFVAGPRCWLPCQRRRSINKRFGTIHYNASSRIPFWKQAGMSLLIRLLDSQRGSNQNCMLMRLIHVMHSLETVEGWMPKRSARSWTLSPSRIRTCRGITRQAKEDCITKRVVLLEAQFFVLWSMDSSLWASCVQETKNSL